MKERNSAQLLIITGQELQFALYRVAEEGFVAGISAPVSWEETSGSYLMHQQYLL